uniref:Ig-like domain-containing protein n=1 Tax=Oryzias latipes TaxID=8090 RepID=A0A3B3H7R4_ORYLA
FEITQVDETLHRSPGSSKVVCSPSTVQAHLGQNVVLSCRVEPPSDLRAEALEWKHGPDVVHVYRSRKDDPDNQVQRFKGRTFLHHQNLKDGNVSLTLTKVTKEDEGNYTFCLPKAKVQLVVSKFGMQFSSVSVSIHPSGPWSRTGTALGPCFRGGITITFQPLMWSKMVYSVAQKSSFEKSVMCCYFSLRIIWLTLITYRVIVCQRAQ